MRLVVIIAVFLASTLSALADSSTYRLKAGDTLDILVWQEEGLQRQVIVAPDGTISFPFAGHLRVGGRTAGQVERLLTARLKEFITDPVVTVTVQGSPKSEANIYVTGQVKSAGQHVITAPTTVMQALTLSGGLTEFAAKRRIKIIRKVKNEEIAIKFDYVDVSTGRDMSTNIRLRNGDVVVVPERGLFGGLFE